MSDRITIIDCQVLQCKAWNRGMGKYTLAFLKELFVKENLNGDKKFNLLFNANLTIPKEVNFFLKKRGLTKSVIMVNLNTPREPREKHSIEPTISENKDILDLMILDKFKNNLPNFLIMALYLDEATPAFPDNTHDKIILYYDSIPYLYFDRYNAFNGFFDNFYLPHTRTLFEATKILTISKTVANDLSIYFGIPNRKIFNINGASIKRTKTNQIETKEYKLKPKTFVLMPTGEEIRKNNFRAVKAFEQFSSRNNLDIKLVITSNFNDETQQKLSRISKNVIFTGNVGEGEIGWLFENAKFLFFPSEYEGLGLPILEAVDMNIPIACSNIPVFREMSSDSFYYFDPLDVDDMAEKLDKLNQSISNKSHHNHGYELIKEFYQWKNTIKLFINALDLELHKNIKRKLRAAIFCPDPTGFSAIGKVITESHAEYSEFFDITYYFDKGPNHKSIRPNLLTYLSKNEDILNFKASDASKFDCLIYHIGNSEYHINIINIALVIKGFAIMHDTFLDGVYLNMTEGKNISKKRYELENELDKIILDLDESGNSRSKCITSIVNNQHAIIVHSDYAKKTISNKIINKNIISKKINLPVSTPKFREIIRTKKDFVQLSFAGIIAQVKGIEIIEELSLSESLPNTHINIFGYSSSGSELISRLSTRPNVRICTNLSDFGFQNLLSSTEILINIRLEYRGETSLTTLEAMRFGVYPVVRDFGWFSEIPSDLVVKVDDIYKTENSIIKAIDATSRLNLSDKIIDYIELNHSHENYASIAYDLILSAIVK